MASVAIVRALSMEADVVRWRNEKCLQQIIVSQLINFRCDVQNATGHRHRTTKAQQSDGWVSWREKKKCKIGLNQSPGMAIDRDVCGARRSLNVPRGN